MHQVQYLQHMGITAWAWRDRAPASQTWCLESVHVYPLHNLAGEPVALLLGDAGADLEAEATLMSAIAAATQRQATGGYQVSWNADPASLPPVLIALGPRVASALQALQPDPPVIAGQLSPWLGQRYWVWSHAPAQLLAERARKAEAWQALKLAMERMA